jgi:hypothetical protein
MDCELGWFHKQRSVEESRGLTAREIRVRFHLVKIDAPETEPVLTVGESTIYYHGMFALSGIAGVAAGYSKYEARTACVRIEPYAQFERAVIIDFVPRGKRKALRYIETAPTSVILKGWGHPDLRDPLDEHRQSRHYLGSNEWAEEFDHFLQVHLSHSSAEVLLDLRKHDAEPRISDPKPNLDEELFPSAESAEATVHAATVTIAMEGEVYIRAHKARERDPVIVAAKRAEVLRTTGKLACVVCGFNFQAVYGILGDGFCEVHHLTPLSAADGEVATRLEDLAVVCANCHRMIHRGQQVLSIQELKDAMSAAALK